MLRAEKNESHLGSERTGSGRSLRQYEQKQEGAPRAPDSTSSLIGIPLLAPAIINPSKRMPKKTSSPAEKLPVPAQLIERRIHVIRGKKVLLDADLAELYQVTTGNLNLAVRRNITRFPEDFMFQLSREEFENLRLQIAISSSGYGGRRYMPYAFTQEGVAMLSSVLTSERAIQMNILIMRVFVQLRDALATHKDLAEKIEKLTTTQQQHGVALVSVIKEIRQLKNPTEPKRKYKIGFRDHDEDK